MGVTMGVTPKKSEAFEDSLMHLHTLVLISGPTLAYDVHVDESVTCTAHCCCAAASDDQSSPLRWTKTPRTNSLSAAICSTPVGTISESGSTNP